MECAKHKWERGGNIGISVKILNRNFRIRNKKEMKTYVKGIG